MYDQGFAQVNSAYNYINRETTNPYNTKVKDQFLRQAKDNLKNLSSMDLSQFQNVEAANSVFAPFHNNTDVVADQALTDHWNREVALGNSFRTKDGGKEFNQTNIDYILQQKNWFAQDTPDSWRDYYATKRSFTPYYDATHEVQEAMKNFKPSHVKTVKVNGFYIQTLDDKSWYEGEVAQYLNSVLSDKAKQQWKIEGAVKYGDNLPLLNQVLNQQASTIIPNVQTNIDDLNIKIRREKDPAKQAELIKQRDGYIDQQNTVNNNLAAIATGDLKMLRKNSEKIAYDIYFNEKLTDLVKGYAHKDIEQDIKFNDVAMMFWKNDQDWAMKRWERQNAIEDRDLKFAHDLRVAGLKSKEGQLPLLIESGNTIPIANTFDGLKNQVEQLANSANLAQSDLKNRINTVMGYPPGHAVTDKEFNAYVDAHPNDNLVFDYVTKKNAVQAGLSNLNNWDINANTYVASKLGEIKWKAYKNLSAVKAKRALTPDEERAFNSLHVAYNRYYHEYHDPKFTLTGGSQFAYGLNTADKRFAEATGGIANYTGLDKGNIGSVSFIPSIKGGVDMKFTVQQDPTKPSWKKDEATKLLDTKLAGTGATYTWDDKTNTVVIHNAPKALVDQYDPYRGLDYSTRFSLQQMATHAAPGGTAEFLIPMQTRSGANVSFRIVKQSTSSGDVYYLKSNKGKILTDGSTPETIPYSSAEEVGQNLKTLTQNFTTSQIYQLLNQ